MGRSRGVRLRPTGWLAAACAANLAAAMVWSPFFALSVVRVVGARTADRAMLQELVEARRGTPVAQLRPEALESDAETVPEADSADFVANVFGSARLTLRYRTPAARLERDGLALSTDGRVYRTRPTTDLSRLPVVRLPAGLGRAAAALLQPGPLGTLATAASELAATWPAAGGVLTLDDAGILCLNRGDAGRVVFGDTDSLEAKMSKLKSLLREHPEVFSAPDEVNLTAPDHPAYRPLRSKRS